jgi:hypothetical protein
LVLGFRASLRVFDGDLYNEFSTTNILLGPRNLCSHVILVERCNFDVHAFCHSRSPLMSHQEQYYAPETGCCTVCELMRKCFQQEPPKQKVERATKAMRQEAQRTFEN